MRQEMRQAMRRGGSWALSELRKLPVALIAALALGLAATFLALKGDPGFGAAAFGPWTSRPRLGSADIDPYARAATAVEGAVPLGSGEGLAFVARADDAGAPLDSRCDYIVSGAALPARFWTLTAYDVEGRLRPNPAGRYGLTSAALLRRADGAFSIVAAREARPGNWLPLGSRSRFTLVLRAYEAASSSVGGPFEGLVMPRIARGECS
jgi:hypothetical protein